MDSQSTHSPTPSPHVEPSTPERDQTKANDTEEILRQCAEARQATRDRELKKAQEQQQLAIRVHAQMRAQWIQPPVLRAFQGPHPAQYFSHPSAIRPPPQSFLEDPTQSSFDIYPPPPSDLMARSHTAPTKVPAPGFGNYPPSGPGFDPQSGFNALSHHGFHDVPQSSGFNVISQTAFHHGPSPGFPPGPRPQQVDHPGHHRKPPPHHQAPGSARMHKSFSAPAPMDPALSSGLESTATPTPTVSGKTAAANLAPSPFLLDSALWTSAANSTAHKPNGHSHSVATRESLSVPPTALQNAGAQPQASNSPSGSPLVFANEEELLNWTILDLGQGAVPAATMQDGRALILPNAWLDGNQWVPHSQPVPCLHRWMAYFNRFIDPTTSAPPHPDAFTWDGDFRPWGNGKTFRDTCERAWFAEAGMDPDTYWPVEQPGQTGVQEVASQQEQPIPEVQSGDASSSTEQNAFQILPPDMEQDLASLLGLSG